MNVSDNKSQLSLSSSPISIYHNSKFSFDDVESVLEPLFGNYYGISELRAIISNVDHIWCAYNTTKKQYVACALVRTYNKDKVLFINLFGVTQACQGQGIGTRLLKAIKNWGQKQKYVAIILHTQVDNYKAIGLYEKVGFYKQYYITNFFPPRGCLSFFRSHGSDAYEMILYL
ncbi:unnamed protein product [Rotaria sordida]|uniref:N-acetyltransferase domain-containing protein n=1 Tax=Rotaria sordida TaxID=392033 RepID=A0A813U4S1_9BILA|nr:unnamed protein product [Rotaria sordida]